MNQLLEKFDELFLKVMSDSVDMLQDNKLNSGEKLLKRGDMYASALSSVRDLIEENDDNK